MSTTSWTQPICRECWNERNPDRQAVSVAIIHLSEPEFCCYCGERAVNGIYVRVDPSTVPFPEKAGRS